MATDEGEHLRQAVFGANDGLVSTFGLVAGLIGANAPQNVLILANVVNMVASGMSMGLGSYLATKSQVEYNRKLVAEVRGRVRKDPRVARRELVRYCEYKTRTKESAHKMAREIALDEDKWVRFIAQEKHGLGKTAFPNPVKGGIIMFVVFVLCGLVPIIPLLFLRGFHALALSALLTGIALFFVGALKRQLTSRTWLSLGLENLIIGAITGTVGFLAGLYTGHLMAISAFG